MRRISPNHPVRRRLFPEAHLEEEARMDNCANVLQESLARDLVAKAQKWNFDFETETALPGVYEWSKLDGENWIGCEINTKVCDNNTKVCGDDTKVCDDTDQMKAENETTPNEKTDRAPPVVRKRKNDAAANDGGARRKISFD